MLPYNVRTMRVLVFGTFDRLHPGHRFVLRCAQARGELFVVVARDVSVRRIKGRDPEESEDVRRAHVAAAVPEATVVVGHPSDYLEPVRAIRPDLILLGYDQELPPGVKPEDLPCPTERLPAFEPQRFKSSVRRGKCPPIGGMDMGESFC